MIDHTTKRIHIHIPKTGGTSLRSVLLPEADETRHQTAGDFQKKNWEQYFTFAFVRNPFDRTVSHYAYHVKSRYKGALLASHPDLKDLSFEEYIERFVVPGKHKQFLAQTQYIVHPRSSKPIDFVGRFEHMDDEYERLAKLLDVSLPELPHKLRSRHRHYSEYFDATTRDMVEKAYESDLYAFGYTFEYS